ncbi:MAG: glycosyltransferase family 39 protein, partial [Myxococcales bacterium]|nr:glycosyltransferase family 39 protein [Myxococcales bacterium]
MTEPTLDDRAPRRWIGPVVALLAFFAVVGAYLLTELKMAGRVGPPLDDGWIYMAFARSLAEGEGITYPGHDGPVASVTGPIWCFLLALAMKVVGANVWASKLLGILVGALGVIAAHRLAHTASKGDLRLAGIAAVLLALTPRYAWGCLSGMEVPWFVAMTCLGLALHLENRDRSTLRWLPAAFTLTLAAWARPECLVLPFLAAAHRFWHVRRIDGFLLAVPLVATFPAYHLLVSGHPLPITFYAKAADGTPVSIFKQEG